MQEDIYPLLRPGRTNGHHARLVGRRICRAKALCALALLSKQLDLFSIALLWPILQPGTGCVKALRTLPPLCHLLLCAFNEP